VDPAAPRTPRVVQHVTASRCYTCSVPLPAGFDFLTPCPKCAAELHCCKQCQHFEPSAHFQCGKPVPERIAQKDKRNECGFFAPLVTVARDSAPLPPAAGKAEPRAETRPKSYENARAAFENLFKK
jgi:hypothetical protein